MPDDLNVQPGDIPPEIEERYEGEWIAWDCEAQQVIAHHNATLTRFGFPPFPVATLKSNAFVGVSNPFDVKLWPAW